MEVLEQELSWLKEHLSQLDSPVVFCHNDLLCKNIIYDSTQGMPSQALAGPQLSGTLAIGGLPAAVAQTDAVVCGGPPCEAT